MKKKSINAAPSIDRRYQIEDDLRTLQRAAEVKGDAKRMKEAMQLHAQQSRGLQSITGSAPSKSTTHRQRLNNRRI